MTCAFCDNTKLPRDEVCDHWECRAMPSEQWKAYERRWRSQAFQLRPVDKSLSGITTFECGIRIWEESALEDDLHVDFAVPALAKGDEAVLKNPLAPGIDALWKRHKESLRFFEPGCPKCKKAPQLLKDDYGNNAIGCLACDTRGGCGTPHADEAQLQARWSDFQNHHSTKGWRLTLGLSKDVP